MTHGEGFNAVKKYLVSQKAGDLYNTQTHTDARTDCHPLAVVMVCLSQSEEGAVQRGGGRLLSRISRKVTEQILI